MHDITNRFRQWMDDLKLSAADVCEALSVSEQTIANWRSAGIPNRRQPHVTKLMADWHTRLAKPLGNSITVHADPHQLKAWNLASMAEGLTIEDWAIRGLDELADDYFTRTLKVADHDYPDHPKYQGPVNYRDGTNSGK